MISLNEQLVILFAATIIGGLVVYWLVQIVIALWKRSKENNYYD